MQGTHVRVTLGAEYKRCWKALGGPALGLEDEVAIGIYGELTFVAADAADSRYMPDRPELVTQGLGRRPHRDALEAVLAAVRARVRASDTFRAI
jgi:hypothetical protein